MVVALPEQGCKRQGRSWITFRLEQGGWRRVWAYKGRFNTITTGPMGSTGRRIKETSPVDNGKNCKLGGSRWRLWRWDGKRFVAGEGQKGGKGGGSGGKGGRKRLVLSPDVATITAGETQQYRVHLFEGKRDLGDVTNQTSLITEYQGSQSICGSPTTTPVTAYCNGLGSCDQGTHTCTAVSPGEWGLTASLDKEEVSSQRE